MQKKLENQDRRTRIIALVACLAVVAAMFLGAILTGVASLEMDKAPPGAMKTDEPPEQ